MKNEKIIQQWKEYFKEWRNKMKEYTLLLSGNTVGTVITKKDLKVGQFIEVKLNDENGNKITKHGKIKEILTVEELC